MTFVHLHNHTQYSLLDGACRVDKMLALVKSMEMPAVAMTDHGNMFGAIDFYKTARKLSIKPIIGIETYIINGSIEDPESKKDSRYHLVLLAKNRTGYKNLMKLSSLAFLKGFYYRPRIDKTILRQHSEGLICLSACLKGELATLAVQNRIEEARTVIAFYKDIFQEDFYVEIQDHNLEEEKIAAPRLIKLARESSTPLVVTNDCHYLDRQDSEAHDVLLCIQTGKTFTDPNRMSYKSDQLYFKSETEMRELFPELTDAYENTLKITDQVDLSLDYSTFLLPRIDLPTDYDSMDDYLRDLCVNAARNKYPQMTDEIRERIEYELSVIIRMGYSGYFLIVKDMIDAAKEMNVPVGPGRGSAVGSVVSYLLGITQIEPIQYGLFFERFLNPDRIGMPDIDIDLCAEGRNKIIDYVIQKYSRESVAQIITFGTLGAKSVIKDVARVLEMPASRANEITKEIPSSPKITLEKALKQSKDFARIMQENDLNISILTYSKVLEGLIRHISIHAAGIVIVPGKLDDYVPLSISTQKNNENAVLVQYEGRWLDDLKILKMDLLGLKTLTLIQKTIELVKHSQNIEIDIENLDLSDKETYELLSRGQTDGIFQFESAGMKRYLIDLKPNKFGDLIAMVALYRPGPMQFIETFIRRKHGNEKVHYIHPLTENALQETYGVTVYQEQVMQIAREMADMTGAQADTLRKAISKKKLETMKKMKDIFFEGASKKGVKSNLIDTVWTNWKEFARYAFNKSHATAYALVAFRTAYLKSHFPVEFMAALLSLEDNPTKIPYFMDECKNMGIEVEPPNINESETDFIVRNNKILFGLKAIKNVGEAAIKTIIEERDKTGKFVNLFEFCSRIDGFCVNKSVVESLVASGAMDELEGSRAQKYDVVEKALDFASSVQSEKRRGQIMLFDSLQEEESEYSPELPDLHEWAFNFKLKKEREVLGFYWSGHPLHKYRKLLAALPLVNSDLSDKNNSTNGVFAIAGVVSEIIKKTDKKGNPFAITILEDLKGKFELCLFNNDYQNLFSSMKEGKNLFIIGKRSSYSNENESILRVIPNRIFNFEELPTQLSGDIYVSLNETKTTRELAEELIKLNQTSPGKFGVHFKIESNKFKTIRLHAKKLKIFPDKEVLEYFHKKLEIDPWIKLNLD